MPLPPKPVFGCLWAPGKRTEPTRLLEIPFLVFSPHLSQLHLLHTQTPGTLGWLGEGQGRRSMGLTRLPEITWPFWGAGAGQARCLDSASWQWDRGFVSWSVPGRP